MTWQARAPVEMIEGQALTEGEQVWGYVVRLKRSASTLGEAHGHKAKKVAKKVAYMRTYHNPRLKDAIQTEAMLLETASPMPPESATAHAPPAAVSAVRGPGSAEVHRHVGGARGLFDAAWAEIALELVGVVLGDTHALAVVPEQEGEGRAGARE